MTLKTYTIISLSTISIIILGIAVVYWYNVNSFLKTSQTIADNRVLVDTETKRAHDVSVLKQKVALANVQQEKISQFFLQKDQIAPFLGYIESIGTNNGSLITIDSVGITKNTKIKNLEVTFKISGTYQQVVSTLQHIEQMPFYSRVQKVVLDVVPDSAGGLVSTVVGADGKPKQVKSAVTDPLWTADITLGVFSFLDNVTDPVVNSNTTKTTN